MKYLITSTLLFTLSLAVSAQKANLLLIDENIDAQELEGNFNVKKGSTLKSYLPAKELRDTFLQAVPESRSWDEYQKDAFYMDIKNKSIKEIHKKYPQFSREKISTLKGKI